MFKLKRCSEPMTSTQYKKLLRSAVLELDILTTNIMNSCHDRDYENPHACRRLQKLSAPFVMITTCKFICSLSK